MHLFISCEEETQINTFLVELLLPWASLIIQLQDYVVYVYPFLYSKPTPHIIIIIAVLT